jgi:hypothetical protein
MHFGPDDIDRYLTGDLDERTLLMMDRQASVSLPWNLVLANRGMEESGWERRGLLGRLVRVDRGG